ncbi:hypothetical protein MMC25_007878 [Agyrium rufum]|nr:hypothetical protein [Agyrium rufum]
MLDHKEDFEDSLGFEEDSLGVDLTEDFSDPTMTASSFNPVNMSTSDIALPTTCSPSELHNNFASAPPSTALTNLSTPSLYTESPFYTVYSTETSPMFAADDLDPDHKNWLSLFPNQNESSSSLEQSASDLFAEPQTNAQGANQMSRNKSSPGLSHTTRGSSMARHSSLAGVSAKKRSKPLPEINTELDDPVLKKRARNTEAARKSRAKKLHHVEELQARVAELEDEIENWKTLARSNGFA